MVATKPLKCRKRKRRQTAGVAEDCCEHQPRKFARDGSSEVRLQHLLPIKTASGNVVSRSQVLATVNDEDSVTVEPPCAERNHSPDSQVVSPCYVGHPLSTVELLLQRERLVTLFRNRIAALAMAIVESPYENVHKLKELLSIARGDCKDLPIVVSSVQKLAVISLLEVYLDILPAYKIRIRSAEEKKQKMKRETQKLNEFEESLLSNYNKYLKFLEHCITKGARKKSSNSKSVLPLTAIQCLCQLLEKHPNFNYQSNIVLLIVPLISHRNIEISDVCCRTVVAIFKSSQAENLSLEIVRCIAKLVRTKHKATSPQLITTFLALKINDVYRSEQSQDRVTAKANLNRRKALLQSKSRRERKRQKELEKVEQELKDLNEDEHKATKLALRTQIMDSVFATYFRILKSFNQTALLSPALAGLSKFAHLVNVELFCDLVELLKTCSTSLESLELLHCIHTAFVILSGDGSALEMDPYHFYQQFYIALPQVLLEFNPKSHAESFVVSLRILELALVKRKGQVTLSRVAGFVKRIACLALFLPVSKAAAYLALVQKCFASHGQLNCIVDREPHGSGLFKPDIEDPEHCNAPACFLCELDLLRSHPHALIRSLASNILEAGNTSIPSLQLSLANVFSPEELYLKLLPKEVESRAEYRSFLVLNEFLSSRSSTRFGEVSRKVEKHWQKQQQRT